MDNVIDLLHQRIAREFAVIYDDLMRDSDKYDVYLVQFDTSINPKPNARDRGVHVELAFIGCSDNAGAVSLPLAYELYPSAAAYNIMHGFNQTTHTGITGMAQTIVGWGLQASFQHDHSSLRSGLSQSIYASGFGAGQCKFGWDFAPAPYENRLAAGMRTTYAILRVPKSSSEVMQASLHVDWPKRDRRYPGWNPLHWFRLDAGENAPQNLSIELPHHHALQLTHVSYVPADTGEKGTGGNSAARPTTDSGKLAAVSTAASGGNSALDLPPATPTPTPRPAVIQVTFRHPVDPNLIITANDQILRRVRDVRGRGLYSDSTTSNALHLAGNGAEIDNLASSRFGLLESDRLGDDTWFQADSRTILLNISRQTAGTDHFPVIRIIDPSSGIGGELTALAREADEVRVGEWFFTQGASLVTSTFQPLFTKPYTAGPFQVFVQNVQKKKDTQGTDHLQSVDLRLVSRATAGRKLIYLNDQAQVVIEANPSEDHYILPKHDNNHLPSEQTGTAGQTGTALRPNWPLDCRQDRGALVCSIPIRAFQQFCGASTTTSATLLAQVAADTDFSCLSHFKVWVDQAPYYGRPGMWGDQDVNDSGTLNANLNPELIPRGNYHISEEKVNITSPVAEYMWVANLDLVNFDKNATYCIPEFAGSADAPARKVSEAAAARKWSGEQLSFWPQHLESVKSQMQPCEDPTTPQRSAFLVKTTSHGISIEVPFAFFPQLPDSLHLKIAGSADPPVEIPSLREQLIPHDVRIIDLGNKKYQFQAEHMRAVHSVYVTSKKDGTSKFITIQSTSYSTLEVDASSLTDGVSYTVQLGIGEGKFGDAYVDLFQSDDAGRESLQVLSIPDKAK